MRTTPKWMLPWVLAGMTAACATNPPLPPPPGMLNEVISIRWPFGP